MKKILLLLLLATFSIQAQTLQNPTYGNVKLKNNTTDNSATKVNVQSTEGTINTISKSDLVNVVEVDNVPSLPLIGEAGKIYVVKNINKIYRWNGTFYQELTTDISGKEDIANKQNSLAVDGTGAKFVTVDAINSVIVNETTGVFSNIQTLVNSAQLGTTINLKPNAIYAQDNSLVLKSGITLNGNGATLKRNAQQTTTTTVSATEVSTNLTVSSVPIGWKTGDYLQLYTNDTYLTSSRKYEVIISSIAGNVITLSQPIGAPASGSTYTWAIGATVRKVFSQITSQRSTDLFTTPTNWTVNNLIIDGNKSNNAGNFYWGVNMAVQNNGRSRFENITIKDIPNDCFFGTGFTIKNSRASNLNASFVHQSGDITVGNSIFGGEITGNTVINSNLKSTTTQNGHSEGVITFSFSAGRTLISGNRFINGGGSLLGWFSYAIDPMDGSLDDLIFTDNYADGFASIIYSFIDNSSKTFVPKNVLISNNIFNNCGVNDFGIYASQINSFGKIKIYDNILNGTTTISNEPWKLSFDKTIRKDYVTLGTTASPNYDKIVAGGIKDSNESGIYFGNSLAENNGTYIKLSTNSSGAPSTPNDALIIKPNGVVDFEQTPTAPTAPAGTNTTQIATTAFVQANSRPYKVYTALLTQTGTNAPVATVLENTLGGTVVWGYSSAGTFSGTCSIGAFTVNKTIGFIGSNANFTTNNQQIGLIRSSDTNISLQTYISGVQTNGVLNYCVVEIRVYL